MGHDISMTVIDSDGAAVFSRSYRDVILDKFEPNGANCPPVCATELFAIDPAEAG